MGIRLYFSQPTGCPINYKILLKEHFKVLDIVWDVFVWKQWKGLSVLTVSLLAKFPQNRERYKKVNFENREDIKKNYARIYTPGNLWFTTW